MNLPDGPFNVIYADPPWTFRTYSNKGKGRSAERHYQCMTRQDIQQLPVSSIAADNCCLFLWVTAPCLIEGIELFQHWGFQYKTVAFTWVKRNKRQPTWFWGMGYWTRQNAEFCLLGTRGKPKRVSAAVHSVIDDPVARHSEKPNSVREKIVDLCGDVPRVELFARQKFNGWTGWGNEV